ncbi:MAG TPA: hypothetical protein DIU05_11860 [Bacteroidetes bacterium]|nr:hypothetical protein [Bacteroidota bacterium]
MSNPTTNILVLADYLPDSGWGGGVIIRSLLENIPNDVTLSWTTFSVERNQKNSKVNNINILPFKPRYIRGQGKFKLIRKLDSLLFASDLNQIIKKNNIQLLWIICGVTYNELYRLSVLSTQLTIPFHITVHDDPIVELESTKKEEGKVLFQTLLSNAKSVDVISNRMRDSYKTQYNINAIVITRGIPSNFPTNSLRDSTSINVLMGGYGNVPSPWPLPLIEAMELMQNDQPSFLHLFDSKLSKWKNEYTIIYENMPEAAFNQVLKTIDIGYACDDLNPARLAFAQLSLPTKIITYIGAGIPFVYHGPQDSTVGDLLKQYEAGIIVSTNDSKQLYDAFYKLRTNYEYYQQQCLLALQNQFAAKIVQYRFYNYILNNS